MTAQTYQPWPQRLSYGRPHSGTTRSRSTWRGPDSR